MAFDNHTMRFSAEHKNIFHMKINQKKRTKLTRNCRANHYMFLFKMQINNKRALQSSIIIVLSMGSTLKNIIDAGSRKLKPNPGEASTKPSQELA